MHQGFGRSLLGLALALAPVVASAADRGAAVPRQGPSPGIDRQPLAEPVPLPLEQRLAAAAGAAQNDERRNPATPEATEAEPKPLVPDAATDAMKPDARQPDAAKSASPAKAAEKPAPPKLCDIVMCRPLGRISITRANGSVVDLDQPGYPFVTPAGAATVLPGETVAIEFAVAEGKLASPTYAAQVRAAGRTVVLELGKSDGSPMLLTVINPFDRPLKYDASIEIVGRDGKPAKLRRTSTCAVAAGTKAFEMWPDAIARVQAENFRLLPAGDASCK
ncbi:MAG: hypothetical protein U1E87_10665 [Alphaproteobacteria bacterium]